MSYTNISADFPEDRLEVIIQSLRGLDTDLGFCVNLTPDEIKGLSKMGDKSIPFVEKGLELAERYPQYCPPYLDLTELRKDVTLAKRLRKLLNILEPLVEKVQDTYYAVGSEAFVATRSFYRSVQTAAKTNVPGSNSIADEMAKRYARKSKNSTPVEITPKVST
jgi:hypothetical protein